jgi:hypothetical protein
MATSAGNQFPAFHSIDALLGGTETAMYGQQYVRRFPLDPKGFMEKTLDLKPQKGFGHGIPPNGHVDSLQKHKKESGN